MKKEEVRKEFFKLRIKGNSYAVCIRVLKATLGYEVTKRTLQRWTNRLNDTNWNLKDNSTKPKTVYTKIDSETESEVIRIRKETGFGEHKISEFIPEISHSTVYRILNKHKLTKLNPDRRKRIKYIRWQREHPNSLWQMDISDQKVDGKYCFAVIDDCSRYCIGIFELNNISTQIITKLLDDLIKVHGKPREILTDNGSVFGLRSKHSKFDRWG